MAHVTKVFFHYEEREFYALARVYSGSIKSGQVIYVLGDSYSADSQDDVTTATVTSVAVGIGEHIVDMERFPACGTAGNLILLKGIHGSITKGATLHAKAAGMGAGAQGGANRFEDEEAEELADALEHQYLTGLDLLKGLNGNQKDVTQGRFYVE